MDLLAILVLLVALVGVFILRIMFLGWQGRRVAKKIIMRFGEAGAITAERARRPEDIGIPLRGPIIGLRDHRPVVLRELIRVGDLLGTEDGRYYLSEEAYRFYNTHRPSQRG